MRGVSDLTRNDRQRDVLLQLLGKVKSLDALTSLVDIVESIADAVTIDDGITIGRAIGLAWDMRSVSPGGIVQVTIPVRNHTTSGRGGGGVAEDVVRRGVRGVLATNRTRVAVPAPQGVWTPDRSPSWALWRTPDARPASARATDS
jgi:anionic cell wall polymer biosynthesis LytR-Cps2A-Psr (LCP) family protein